MIKHIVLWKLKDEAEGRSKIENAHLMKTKLEALPLMISELNSVEVGVNIFDNKEASTCDLVLIASLHTKLFYERALDHLSHQVEISM